MPSDPNSKRQSILAAALIQFGRYGFRRTSMADIAKEAGVSRASLYSHFENKGEIFRGLSASLHEDALRDAATALKGNDGAARLEERVESALVAQLGWRRERVTNAPHASEFADENSQLCGDVVSNSSSRFQELLAAALDAAAREGEVDLKAARLTAKSAAELLRLAAAGLELDAPHRETFRARLKNLIRVFFAGLS
jgi:AcrR family transcriptional regulator